MIILNIKILLVLKIYIVMIWVVDSGTCREELLKN
jgi:hypothetical protein